MSLFYVSMSVLESKQNFDEIPITVAKSIFDERRDSFDRCLAAILHKINSISQTSENLTLNQELKSYIESTITRNITTEREVFLSYVMYLIMKNEKQIIPAIFTKFLQSKAKLDSKFDKNCEISSILSKYTQGKPSNRIVSENFFPNYVSKVICIFYGTLFFNSMINDTRILMKDFISNTMKLMQEMKNRSINSFKRISMNKTIQHKNDEIQKLQNQLDQCQVILKERDKHRLELEGHAIRIIQYLNSIEPKKIEDTATQLTLEELKRQSKSLRKSLKATISVDSIEFNQKQTDLSLTKDNLNELIRQSQLKDDTISNLRKEIDELRSNASKMEKSYRESFYSTTENHNHYLHSDLLKTKGELNYTREIKSELMNEVVQKTDKLRDYYEMKADFEDLKLEFHALQQKKIESDQYAEVLNQENIKLKKQNDEMKAQLTTENAGFDALYDKSNRLEAKVQKQKERINQEKVKSNDLEVEIQNKTEEIRKLTNQLKKLSEDHNSDTMKNELLMEQITNLKTDMAIKENDFVKMQKTVDEGKRINDLALEKENEKNAEISQLKEKIQKLSQRKQNRDEKIEQLQKLIDASAVKMQEKDLLMDKYELKISDQKTKIISLNDKLSKASEVLKAQKAKIKELENSMADLHFRMKDSERNVKRNETEMNEMKEATKNYNDVVKKKEELERQIFQHSLELDNLKQKNQIISSSLESQIAISEKIQNELNDTKKRLADTQNQHETLKYQHQAQLTKINNDMENTKYEASREKEKLETDISDLTNKLQIATSKIKSLNQLNAQFETQLTEIKQKNHSLQDQITEINAQNKKKVKSLQEMAEKERAELTEQIQDSQQAFKQMENKYNDINKKYKEVQNESNDFKLNIYKLVNPNDIQYDDDISSVENETLYKNIQNINESLNNADTFIKTMNKEINKTKAKNQNILNSMDPSIIQNNSPLAQISLLTQMVDTSSQMIRSLRQEQENQNQILKQVNLQNISELPILNKKLNDAMKETVYYQSIIRQIGQTSPFTEIDSLPQVVSELKQKEVKLEKENANYTKVIDAAHQYVIFENANDMVQAIESLANEEKRKTKELSQLNEEFQKTLEIKNDYEEKLGVLSNTMNIDDFQELPQKVEEMSIQFSKKSNEHEKLQKSYNTMINQMQQIIEVPTSVDFEGDNEFLQAKSIVANVRQISEKNKKLSTELASTKDELKDKSNIVSQISKTISIDDDSQLPRTISKLIERKNYFENELKKNENKHQHLTSQLSQITNVSDEEKIPLTVIKLYQQNQEMQIELENAKKDHQGLLSSIREYVDFNREKQIPKILNQMVENQKVLAERSALLDKVEKIALIENDIDAIDKIQELYKTSQNHQKMMNDIHSVLTFSDQKEAAKLIKDRINVLSQIQSSLSVSTFNDLPLQIESMKEVIETHEKLVSDVQNYLNISKEDQIPSTIKEMAEKNAEQKKVIQKIEKYVVSFDFNETDSTLGEYNHDIPTVVAKILKENKELNEKRRNLNSSLHSIITFHEEEEIPEIVTNLVQSNKLNKEKNENCEKVFESIRQSVEFEKINDLPNIISNMNQKIDTLDSIIKKSRAVIDINEIEDIPEKFKHFKSVEEKMNHEAQILNEINEVCPIEINSIDDVFSYSKVAQSVFENIQSSLSIDSPIDINAIKQLPELIKNLKQIEADFNTLSNFFKQILFCIYGSNSQFISSLTFPIDSDKMKSILSSITDYCIKHEAMRIDFEKLLASARSLGFTGNSCVEASDFLAEELCKKKAQEQLEEMVNQMKVLRESKDKERKLFEQRNAKNQEKIKQIRDSKAQLTEQYAQKQTELYDTIESLQKETREFESRVELLTRTKEELIRIVAKEPYDKESLLTWLTPSEKTRLKL